MRGTSARTTIVALGDSTTAGTPGFLSPLEAPPDGRGEVRSQYAYWLGLGYPEWRILNRGINGERSDQIQQRFDRDVLEARPAVVIILAGVNDLYQGKPVEAVKANLSWMYERAGTAGIPVVAGSILPFNTATPEQNAGMRAVNDWIRAESRRLPNLRFCDTRAAVGDPENADKLAGSPDDLHPDITGYSLMAAALAPVVEQALGSKRSPP